MPRSAGHALLRHLRLRARWGARCLVAADQGRTPTMGAPPRWDTCRRRAPQALMKADAEGLREQRGREERRRAAGRAGLKSAEEQAQVRAAVPGEWSVWGPAHVKQQVKLGACTFGGA